MAPDSAGDDDETLESHVRAPTTDKPNTKRVNFSVDTTKAQVFKADDDSDPNTYLKVPISSLNEDRDGDELSEDGMESLLSQVSGDPVGLFPNHGMDPDTAMYDFREVFGAWEDGEMDGKDTFGTVRLKRVAPDSDELVDDAKQLVNSVEQDMPVGFSIGFGWDEKDAEELDSGGMRFHDLDLMEISAVGIPSNPSAVVQAGTEIAASVKSAGLDPTSLDTDRLTKSLRESMSTKEEDEEDDDEEMEQEQEGDGEKQLDEEALESIQSTVASVVETHADAIVADVMESLAGEMEEDEEDEEETEEGDTDDDEEEDEEEYDTAEAEKLAGEVEKLRGTVEQQSTEIETLKSDLAESAGKKGGMEPTEGKTDEEEEADEETKQMPPEEWAAGIK